MPWISTAPSFRCVSLLCLWQDVRRCPDGHRECPPAPHGCAPHAPSIRTGCGGGFFAPRDLDPPRSCGEWRGSGDAAPAGAWPDCAPPPPPPPPPVAWPLLLPPPAGFGAGWPGGLPDLPGLALSGGWPCGQPAGDGGLASALLHHHHQQQQHPHDLGSLLAAGARQRQLEDQLQSRLCLLASMLPSAALPLLAGAGSAGRPGPCLPPLRCAGGALGGPAEHVGGPSECTGGPGLGAGLLQALLQSAAVGGASGADAARAAAKGPAEDEPPGGGGGGGGGRP
jgi:hypothetical protein